MCSTNFWVHTPRTLLTSAYWHSRGNFWLLRIHTCNLIQTLGLADWLLNSEDKNKDVFLRSPHPFQNSRPGIGPAEHFQIKCGKICPLIGIGLIYLPKVSGREAGSPPIGIGWVLYLPKVNGDKYPLSH